jgi:alpha-mannosidase
MRISGPDGVERDAELGMELGPLWATWWLDVEAEVPASWARVDLLLVTNSEATVWVDGEPVQGLVSGAGRDRIAATLVPAGGKVTARVEIACNGLFGWAELNPPPQQPVPIPPAFRLERCEIARFDPDAWALACDLGVLSALMDEEEDAWGGELLRELNRFCNTGDRSILTRLLERHNGTSTHAITAIGHAHIDTAWLWPVAETRRKVVHTVASAKLKVASEGIAGGQSYEYRATRPGTFPYY